MDISDRQRLRQLGQFDLGSWVEVATGQGLWSIQKKIATAMSEYRATVAVPSCHASGKSFLAAQLALAFFDAYTPGTPCETCGGPCHGSAVITTSSKKEHLENNLWGEVRRALAKVQQVVGFDGEILPAAPQLRHLPNHFIVGQVATSEEGLQGTHQCFDDQTEILTDRGWLPFAELLGTERVLTLNGDVAEWGPITQVHKYDFDGTLAVHDGTKVNFAITNNHRLVAKRRPHNDWEIEEYQNLPQRFTLRRTNTWAGTSPDTISFDSPEFTGRTGRHPRRYTFNYGDWAEFLGWFISEGSVSEWGGQWTISIAQSRTANPEKWERIRQLLDRMGWKGYRGSEQFTLRSRPIADHLLRHCGKGALNKRVPEYLKNASSESMERFLESFGLGDGSPHNGGTRHITGSKLLADDLQEMLAKLGRARSLSERNNSGFSDNPSYVVHDAKEGKDSTVLKKNVVQTPYKGFVWCVSTPHQTIMVRRKGRAMWSGNSHKLIIADEATSVSEAVSRGITGLRSSGDTRLLCIFNPTTPDTWAAKVTRSPSTEVIKIRAYDTPGFTGEEMPAGANLLVPAFLDLLKEEGNGPGTYLWTTRIDADFWDLSDDSLIAMPWIEACRTTPALPGTISIGVDMAAYGTDESTIAVRNGNTLVHIEAHPSGRVDHFFQGPVADAVTKWSPDYVVYDADGVGAGAIGYAEDLKKIMKPLGEVIGFRGAISVNNSTTNMRSHSYWNLRKLFQTNTIRFDVHDGPLEEQLINIKYSINNGKIKLETKKEMRTRGVHSPDRADAVNYAFAYADDLTIRMAGSTPTQQLAEEMGIASAWDEKSYWENERNRLAQPANIQREGTHPILGDDW